MRDYALQLARAGFKVLACARPVPGPDGKLVCNCNRQPCEKSPGKHPHWELSPNGAYSATSDVDEIMTWPDDDSYNLGVALTDTMVAIDVDEPDIAAAILALEDIRDMACISTTGRGLHSWVQCAPTRTANMKHKESGLPVGEVRAHGAYVIVPPSLHISGREYMWVNGRDILMEDGIEVRQTDGWAFAREMFSWVNVELADPRKVLSADGEVGEVGPVELPFTPDQPEDFTLRQYLTGTYPYGKDRSTFLYLVACELVRRAYAHSVDIDEHTIAGVVYPVAAAYGKFVGDRPADATAKVLWELAMKARQDVRIELKMDDGDVPPEPPEDIFGPPGEGDGDGDGGEPRQPVGDYRWDEAEGWFLDLSGRAPKKVANFELKLIECVMGWDGERIDGAHVDWVLQARQRDELVTIRLSPEEYGKGYTFTDTLRKKLPSHFVVRPAYSSSFCSIVQEYSGQRPIRIAYAATGWLPDRDAFLFPGAEGALTADGYDTSVHYDNAAMPERWMSYGTGMQPPVEGHDLVDTLRRLYGMSDPAVTVPLMTQVFAAPLASLGAANSAAVVHIQRRSGALKSSIARVALSLYGMGFTDTRGTWKPDPWGTTLAAVQGSMNRLRDLPYVLDDYKEATMAQRGKTQEAIQIIQNYSDGTGKVRSSANQREQRHLVPRCLLVSTGETMWEGQESTNARTIVVVPPSAIGGENLRIASERLTPAQEEARGGRTQALGYEWIRWLASKGQRWLRAEIERLQGDMREQTMRTALSDQHARVGESIAGLLAIDVLIRQFFAEVVPGFLAEYREMSKTGWLATTEDAVERAAEAQLSSPWGALGRAIKDGAATGECYLSSRTPDHGTPYGMPGSAVVGFIDEEFVYLSKGITFAWFEKWTRQRGADLDISWVAFMQEATRDHGASVNRQVWCGISRGYVYSLVIPIAEFFNAEEMNGIGSLNKQLMELSEDL